MMASPSPNHIYLPSDRQEVPCPRSHISPCETPCRADWRRALPSPADTLHRMLRGKVRYLTQCEYLFYLAYKNKVTTSARQRRRRWSGISPFLFSQIQGLLLVLSEFVLREKRCDKFLKTPVQLSDAHKDLNDDFAQT